MLEKKQDQGAGYHAEGHYTNGYEMSAIRQKSLYQNYFSKKAKIVHRIARPSIEHTIQLSMLLGAPSVFWTTLIK